MTLSFKVVFFPSHNFCFNIPFFSHLILKLLKFSNLHFIHKCSPYLKLIYTFRRPDSVSPLKVLTSHFKSHYQSYLLHISNVEKVQPRSQRGQGSAKVREPINDSAGTECRSRFPPVSNYSTTEDKGLPLLVSFQSKKEYKINPLRYKRKALLWQNPLRGVMWQFASLVLIPQNHQTWEKRTCQGPRIHTATLNNKLIRLFFGSEKMTKN